ncbi:uncharacterized protein LOC123686113 [Harmonia axyridis]|uniref:uncharacterized protein LOC123686113 n=1 Tax=Harmonia axyridis TaxID=115357 RepID=UPI001E278C4E|nr:uncharacterized protein LOC123686113 [Harmonia axyridis]
MERKNYNPNNTNYFQELSKFLEDDSNDPADHEDLGEESEVEEVDQHEDDQSSEQDGESQSSDEDALPLTEIGFYMGRDNETKWNKKPPSEKRHTPSQNKMVPGTKGNARNAKTVLDCWKNLFTDEIIDIIVKYTNQYIDTIQHEFSRGSDVRHTDVVEIHAFIGLLYLAGVYKSSRQCLEELWGQEGDGIEKFSLVMSMKRFKFLIRSLRFDDRTTRDQRKTLDRLAPIREIFDKFIMNCQNSYVPTENVTIGEMLLGFSGRCPFRQCIPSKPNKYGIKIFALVDVKMLYTFNMEIYAGTQPEGPFHVSNKHVDVVKRIAAPLFGSGRNITADNWFTDFNLIHELKTRKLSYVGAVSKNMRQIPNSFVNLKERTQNSSLFGFNNGTTLVSYVQRKGENTILASSLHFDDAIDLSSGDKKKPEIFTFYNSTKNCVNTLDQMCANYSVHRNINQWPMVIFFAMLNVGGINSQVIHLCNQSEPLRRKRLLKQLSHELAIPHMKRRSQMSGLHSSLQVRLKRFFPRDDRENSQTPPNKRRKCSTCSSEEGRRTLTNYACRKCNNGVCLTHANMFCNACFSECHILSSNEDSD